jgi:hypothetical protein
MPGVISPEDENAGSLPRRSAAQGSRSASSREKYLEAVLLLVIR